MALTGRGGLKVFTRGEWWLSKCWWGSVLLIMCPSNSRTLFYHFKNGVGMGTKSTRPKLAELMASLCLVCWAHTHFQDDSLLYMHFGRWERGMSWSEGQYFPIMGKDQKLYTSLLLIYYWPHLRHMTTLSHNKIWEIWSLLWISVYLAETLCSCS